MAVYVSFLRAIAALAKDSFNTTIQVSFVTLLTRDSTYFLL